MKKMLVLLAALLTVASANAQWNDRDSSPNCPEVIAPILVPVPTTTAPAPAPANEDPCTATHSGWNESSFPPGCHPGGR